MRISLSMLLTILTFNLSAQTKTDFEGIWEPQDGFSSFYLLIDYVEETDSITDISTSVG